MLKLTAQGFNSLTFGHLDVPVFKTYAAAREYVHSQMNASADTSDTG